MSQFKILFKKELMELYRTKKVLIISIIFIFFTLISPIIAKMMPEIFKMANIEIPMEIPEANILESYSQFIKNNTQITMLAIIIAFGSLIVGEKIKGLYYTLINNGVKNINFILAKIASQTLLVTVVYLFSILLFSILNLILFNAAFVDNSLIFFLAIYIYLLFIISITNLFSAITKTRSLSIILSITSALFLSVFNLFKFGKYLPGYLINISSEVINTTEISNYVYSNLSISLLLSVLITFLTIKLCKNN